MLEVPDSHPAPEGAVGLGSQKSKDEQGPPHQGVNGYHEDFLCLSTRYREYHLHRQHDSLVIHVLRGAPRRVGMCRDCIKISIGLS